MQRIKSLLGAWPLGLLHTFLRRTQMRTRKIRTTKPVVISQMAVEEQRAWEIERQQRFLHRPTGSQPSWVDLDSPWRR